MNLHREPIPVAEAVKRVLSLEVENYIEKVNIENSYDRILAEDIVATHSIPPFNKSPYDGFAIHSESTNDASKTSPVHIHVIEEIGAGHRASRAIAPGEAVRIMTGAEIPEGADCVAMFEICQTYEAEGESYMTIKRSMEKGQNIIEQGSETKKGTLLVEKGTAINPGVKALLATFGYSTVQVYRKPVVGVFATGTELLDVDQALEPGKIRNSNAYMVTAQIERSGAEPLYLGKLADEFDRCYEAVSEALNKVDMLITTGGVSVGDYDLMPDVYEKLGAEVLFNKIAMRPGSVTTVAQVNGQLMFGLSGNPSACYVGFELYVYPYIQKSLNKTEPYHSIIEGILGTDIMKPNPFTRFIRGSVAYEKGKVTVYPAGIDKSAVVTSLAHTNAFIVLKGGTRGYQKGDKVQVLLLSPNEGSQFFKIDA
ncbi:molybdopterin molybdotransferase MoeA [Halobacillus sp. A1]|uniref:molybdopterin molybdotransferase MoeA n=1 Tax=Halobacillus sp. A1 TaxID=2880262 RepID=UPI0020A6AAF4|nr:gephyrin-like molybdotransferase Glp [Halobacillus sp. A1]MCP3030613.1 molybdopterin molybdotransferase MoeA [Halobacillus sp. A1]